MIALPHQIAAAVAKALGTGFRASGAKVYGPQVVLVATASTIAIDYKQTKRAAFSQGIRAKVADAAHDVGVAVGADV